MPSSRLIAQSTRRSSPTAQHRAYRSHNPRGKPRENAGTRTSSITSSIVHLPIDSCREVSSNAAWPYNRSRYATNPRRSTISARAVAQRRDPVGRPRPDVSEDRLCSIGASSAAFELLVVGATGVGDLA
jgi:hypothetical protein